MFHGYIFFVFMYIHRGILLKSLFSAVFADLHATANPVYYTIRVDRDGHRDRCSQHYCMTLLGKIKLKYLEEIKKMPF